MAEVRHTPFTDSSPSHIFLECHSHFVPLGLTLCLSSLSILPFATSFLLCCTV